MSLRLAATFARRELRGGLRGFRIFVACLALGVMAIAAVGTTREAIQTGLASEAASMLGGDVEIRFTYRYAAQGERNWMHDNSAQVSEVIDFRSMAVVGKDDLVERGLTQVQAVDDSYPLIGAVTLEPPMALAQAFAPSGSNPGAVLEQVLADRLGLVPGDTFRLGTQSFTLTAILQNYPDSGVGGFSLGPRTLVLSRDLANAGLLAEGTMFETNYRMKLPDGADFDRLEQQFKEQFPASGLRWQDARNGAGGLTRFVNQLGAFLVLIGLAGLAVGGVGISTAVRAYLAGKTGTIATLKTLGASRWTIFLTYFLQIGVLALFGICLGLIAGVSLPLLLAPLIKSALPFPANFQFYPWPLLEAAIYGVLTTLIFTLWPLARAQDIPAATLFRDAFGNGRKIPRWPYLVAILIAIALLVAAAVWFSGNRVLSLWTAAAIASALLILSIAAAVARVIAKRAKPLARNQTGLRLALGSIGTRAGETTAVVLSLGLGLSVLAAVGQVDGNIQRTIEDELPQVAPSYFVLDIQPDQIERFKARLAAREEQVSRVDAAPMLRGVITMINDVPASQFADHWVLHGDRGVTYANEMPDGTTLTDGEWWDADYSGPPLISFSHEEAMEMGLSLGDSMTVNILGRDITGTIANLREVDFGSAGIGFVMTMNAGALAGAPHSWISTIYATPEAEAPILRDLAEAYPNITAIRVRDAIEKATEVIGGIASAIRYGALATLLTGIIVLIGAAAAGVKDRTYEAAVLKTLGASRAQILRSFALRSALLGAVAGAVALAAGIVGGWAVTVYVMEADYAVIWPNALAIITGGTFATLLAGLAYAWWPLAARPAQVLRARE